ncbi:MAG: hypothetical protein V4590_03125 [Bacteroidota bacterium]
MDKISNDEIISALNRSGYLLENRILKLFIKNSFYAESSHALFFNPEENKYREIDILATKQLHTMFLEDKFNSVAINIHFVVECINNPQPLGLFENLGDMDEPSSDWIYEITNGTPELRENISLKIHSLIDFVERTRIKAPPSRQYCGFSKKKDTNNKEPWMATHSDDFHKTLLKLVEATKHKKEEINRLWDGRRPQICRLDFIIPTVVLQGNIISVFQRDELKIKDELFQRLKTPYEEIYNRNMSVDIVQENYFEQYLITKQEWITDIINCIIEILR